VIASELKTVQKDGKVCVSVGTETARGCRRAEQLHQDEFPDHEFLATAGLTEIIDTNLAASSIWQKLREYLGKRGGTSSNVLATVWMANLMEDFVKQIDPQLRTHRCCSSIFKTTGEARELAFFCVSHRALDPVTDVVVVVKRWQALRAWLLCKHWLKMYGQDKWVKLTLRTYSSPITWIPYECLALLKEIWTMTKEKFFAIRPT